jgi:hypothetical protein
MRVGSTLLLGVPGEMTVQMGRRVEAAVLRAAGAIASRAAIAGIANSYVSYITTPEEYAADYYEGSWSLYGPQEGNLFRNELVALTAAMAQGGPVSSVPAPPWGVMLDRGINTETRPPLKDDATEVGKVLVEPSNASRGSAPGPGFAWIGGDPGVDGPRGQGFVTLQQEVEHHWTDVAGDGVPWLAVRNDHGPTPNRSQHWSIATDFPLDLPLGNYRFVVAGRFATQSGSVPYRVTSTSFQVEASQAINPQLSLSGTTVNVVGKWLAPGAAALLPRPRVATCGQLTLTVTKASGSSQLVPVSCPANQLMVVSATVPGLTSGDVVSIGPGQLLDAYGNSNGSGVSVSVP